MSYASDLLLHMTTFSYMYIPTRLISTDLKIESIFLSLPNPSPFLDVTGIDVLNPAQVTIMLYSLRGHSFMTSRY